MLPARLLRGAVGGTLRTSSLRLASLNHGVSLRSSGVIFDPFTYVPPEDQPSLLSPAGLQAKVTSAASVAKSSYSSAFIQKHFPAFSHRTFPDTAEAAFTRFMDAYRAGDVALLRGCVTEGLLDGLRLELKAYQEAGGGGSGGGGGGSATKNLNQNRKGKQPLRQGASREVGAKLRSAFVVTKFARRAEVVQMRHGFTAGVARGKESGFAQVTCLVFSERAIVHVDSSGHTVAGKPGAAAAAATVSTPSLLVLEVGFGDMGANWRIARIEEVGSRANLPLPLQ
jgi:hypothetical protein